MVQNANAYPRIEIHGDKRKAVMCLFGSLLFVTLGCCMLVLPDNSLLTRIIGAVGAIFFGLCICIWTKRCVQTQAIWVIDEHGILDTSNNRLIRWQDISSISAIRMQKQQMVCIQLFNETEFVRSLHGWHRYIMILNRKIGYRGIYIPAATIDCSTNTLAETLEDYRQHFLPPRTPFQAA